VFDTLEAANGDDVEITSLHAAAYPSAVQRIEVRKMQQRLGPIFARIKEKRSALSIVPGDARQTYKMVRAGKK
jgi:hypothetical protein